MSGNQQQKSLAGRTLYIPRMSDCSALAVASVFESFGIRAQLSPASDSRTLELSGQYTDGDECLPQKITLGNFVKVIRQPDFDTKKTAFLLFTADGPCRFGQYKPFLNKVLRELGLEDIMIVAPTSANSYDDLGEYADGIFRNTWRAIVATDILRKLLLLTRPYELEKGSTNRVFQECLDQLCRVLAMPRVGDKQRLKNLTAVMKTSKDKFRALPARYTRDKPLIGVVGEIFCRLNDFSNNFFIEKIEEHGGVVWLSDIAEWIWYTNDEQRTNLIDEGKRFSLQMLKTRLKFALQKSEEKTLYKIFKEDFTGVEEPDIHRILSYSKPFLPADGVMGEMVLNTGKTIYLYHKGADAAAEISPFTCMNGIVCEAIYPEISRRHDNFPIRTFYFDGTATDIDNDIAVFMELVRNYRQRKKIARIYPSFFKPV